MFKYGDEVIPLKKYLKKIILIKKLDKRKAFDDRFMEYLNRKLEQLPKVKIKII